MKIKYPTWKIRGTPTPNDSLYICDSCGQGHWGTNTTGSNSAGVCYCTKGRKGGPVRMRKATAAETELGKLAIKEIIGQNFDRSLCICSDLTAPFPTRRRGGVAFYYGYHGRTRTS